jgi:chromosome segregation ATPase
LIKFIKRKEPKLSLKLKIAELQTAVDSEQRNYQEALRLIKNNDKRIRELAAENDDEKKTQARLQDLIDNLQNKIKVYKKQAEDAEEIATLNLTKYRKLHSEFEDAVARADNAESQVAKLRALNRNSVSKQ